jgi:mRNA interferase MazF
MKRGDIVAVAAKGDYGKPRPAVIVQSDTFDDTDSVLVCLITTTLRRAPLYRLDLPADSSTGLRKPSQVMVEKVIAVRREKCGRAIGRMAQVRLIALTRMLALLIGAAD